MKARLAITFVILASTTAIFSCAGQTPSSSAVEKHYGELTIRGKVIRAYPYRKHLIGNVGRRDGLREGDVVLLARDGAIINHVLVEDVKDSTFYGRTMDRDPNAPQPRDGDDILRDPRIYESREAPAVE